MKFATVIVIALAAPSVALGVTINTVSVGNPGNANDVQSNGLFGRVTTSYNIGQREVTNAQYVEFLNAKATSDPLGLYNSSMGLSAHGGITRSGASGSYTYAVKTSVIGEGPAGGPYTYGDKPVVYVSWYDAVRFANWMHNGQGTGNTESGAYMLTGGTAIPTNGNSVARQSGATWFLPTEDEWYKAAYYDGTSATYRDFPTNSNVQPNHNAPANDTGNSANFLASGTPATGSLDYPMTPAGAYTLSDSAYQTFDQGGNVWEWNEAVIVNGSSTLRGRRGGGWNSDVMTLAADYRDSASPFNENDTIGFRLANVPPPIGVPGDYNGNGTVDAADYVLWRNGGPLQNEVNAPGTINAQDYTEWRARFGNTANGSGLSGAQVPEPGSWILFALGALLARSARGGRRN